MGRWMDGGRDGERVAGWMGEWWIAEVVILQNLTFAWEIRNMPVVSNSYW